MPMANSPPFSRSMNSDTGSENSATPSAGQEHRDERVDAGIGEADGEIGADAEEHLLADGDQPAEAGERVPHRCEDHVDEQRGQPIDEAGAEEEAARRARQAMSSGADGDGEP